MVHLTCNSAVSKKAALTWCLDKLGWTTTLLTTSDEHMVSDEAIGNNRGAEFWHLIHATCQLRRQLGFLTVLKVSALTMCSHVCFHGDRQRQLGPCQSGAPPFLLSFLWYRSLMKDYCHCQGLLVSQMADCSWDSMAIKLSEEKGGQSGCAALLATQCKLQSANA